MQDARIFLHGRRRVLLLRLHHAWHLPVGRGYPRRSCNGTWPRC
jgi:hypothetical protein